MTETARYAASDLMAFASGLLTQAGLPLERALNMAEILVKADLMGHTTHGLNLLAPYLRELEAGTMTKEGSPFVVADNGATVTWDAQHLPGPCLVLDAMNLAFERIQHQPMVTIAIRHSHHITCLAAYMKRATDKDLFMLLACSDPSEKVLHSVARI